MVMGLAWVFASALAGCAEGVFGGLDECVSGKVICSGFSGVGGSTPLCHRKAGMALVLPVMSLQCSWSPLKYLPSS
ncbi:uncharacterized protein EDB93DRAFT_290556 [Suillus bovinus]|uniref:uncharacterized protein n=1 Tax=Suillus bovinus TaxID=48563 RepID=UPI001B865BA9|nr:uncharacterized protein EDB93DRAFT_290556 [Suillus bovinus]KAG2159486.1 hypothetical protein EDB93DRAFT_290556 [Suillus bovinus]